MEKPLMKKWDLISICADGVIRLNDGGKSVDVGHVKVYDFCIETSSVDVHSACDTFTWIDGNTYTASNKRYFN